MWSDWKRSAKCVGRPWPIATAHTAKVSVIRQTDMYGWHLRTENIYLSGKHLCATLSLRLCFFNVTNISVLSEVTLLTSTSSTIVIIFIV